VTKALVLITLSTISVLVAAPAAACRGPSAEKFLIWYRLPDILPGEVAIEIDARDFVENLKRRDYKNPEYRIKRVLVGVVDGESIRVQSDTSSCSRENAAGVAERLVLVGRLRETPDALPVLIPRYMSYDDPIRAEAEAKR